MQLLDYARNEIGLAMGGVFLGRHYGWTTDRAKADAMRQAGAYVVEWPCNDPRPDARRFDGCEISFSIGTEKWEGVNAYNP